MKLKRIVPPMLCRDVPTAGTRSASRPKAKKIRTHSRILGSLYQDPSKHNKSCTLWVPEGSFPL